MIVLLQFGGAVVCSAQRLVSSDKPGILAPAQSTGVSRAAAATPTPTVSALSVFGIDPYSLTCNLKGAASGGGSGPSGSVNFTDATTGQALGSAPVQATGTGRAFRQASTFATGSSSISVGDLNGDGIPDLILAGDERPIQIELGTGGGNYQAGQQITVPAGIMRRWRWRTLTETGSWI